MRHFGRARRGALGGLMVLTIGCFAVGGFTWTGPAASASTTTTVVIKFADLAACGPGVYFCYTPSPATVSVGDTVDWTDQSGFGPHTVTRCDPQDCAGQDGGTGSDSPLDGSVGPGQDFSHTFVGPGTYFYYCRIHGYGLMHGAVTVAAGGTTTTSTTATTASTTTTTTASATVTTTTTATTPASEPLTTAIVGATSSDAAPAATSSSVDNVDPVTTGTPLARTGQGLGLVSIGATVLAVGVVLVSAEHRTRRRARMKR